VPQAPNGKAGVMFWTDKTPEKNEFMLFKLEGKAADDAMKLKGAKVFEPVEGRRMNGWIQLSTEHAARWKSLAKKSMDFVKTIET